MTQNPILDINFLNELIANTDREVFARVTALDWNENPVEYIEGKVTGGNINVDGTSAVRRTCTLTMVAVDVNINEFYWGIKNKFRLEIGLKNEINNIYDNIIWFKQGLFVINSFSTNQSTNNWTINISGKDKMCLLNGDLAGNLPHNTDFGIEEYHDKITDTVTYTSIPIKDIIRESVQNFGNELPQNIIINDIEDAGLELLEYRGDVPLYLFREINSDQFLNMSINSKQSCYYQLSESIVEDRWNCLIADGRGWHNYYNTVENHLYILKDEYKNIWYRGAISDTYIIYDNLSNLEGAEESTQLKFDLNIDKIYKVAKFEYGSIPGYRLTDLVYAGDLIANAGETLTSVLDKIKNMLSDFEYFYNIDGKFVFQKKREHIISPWNATENGDDEVKIDATINTQTHVFSFINSHLVSSFNNAPNLNNLKNDYTVWGTRTLTSGTQIPVHMRYAIDFKPTYYKSYDGTVYTTEANLVDKLIANRREELIEELQKLLDNFEMKYAIPSELLAPNKLENGTYSAGWWDIRDWYEYYKIIKKEEPNKTMKWYSQNDETGCIKASNIPGYANRNTDVWLIIRNGRTGTYNLQHGSGTYSADYVELEQCYYSKLDPTTSAGYKTYPVEPPLYGEFHAPYCGCTNTHTYLEFLKSDIERQGNTVYFYNPKFPDTKSTQDAIDSQVKIEIEEWIEKNPMKVVDWREIIYQMAIDYRKHYHEDDFLFTVSQNNYDYYPTGRTGYEQYYVDMEGFWRNIYDPNPDVLFEPIAYKEAEHWQDMLYIQHSYRKLQDSDLDYLNLNRLYVLETKNGKESIYPYLGSEYCHLNDGDIYYYITKDNVLNLGTTSHEALNSVGLDEIYIKYREPFTVKNITIHDNMMVKTTNVGSAREEMWTYIFPVRSLTKKEINSEDYDLFVNTVFPDMLANNRDKLYIKDTGYIKFSDLEPEIQKLYLQDGEYQEYVRSYDVDNYNNLGPGGLQYEQIHYNRGYYNYWHAEYEQDDFWSKDITNNPEQLLFWFDFLDPEANDLIKYAVPIVGQRTKIINDKDVKSIYYREIPTTIFKTKEELKENKYEPQTGYTYIQLQNTMENLFTISSKGKSCKERIDELLYQHSYCIENSTIQTVPVYHLEPNTRILIRDDNSSIDGEYNILKLTIPLTYNAMMSITATKVVSSIT